MNASKTKSFKKKVKNIKGKTHILIEVWMEKKSVKFQVICLIDFYNNNNTSIRSISAKKQRTEYKSKHQTWNPISNIEIGLVDFKEN